MKTQLFKSLFLIVLCFGFQVSAQQFEKDHNTNTTVVSNTQKNEGTSQKAGCIDCKVYGSEVGVSITPLPGRCGQFSVTAPANGLGCFSIIIRMPSPYSDIYVTPGTTEYFSFDDNGFYSVVVEIQPGGALYCSKQTIRLKVDSYPEPLPDCADLGDIILDSITETSCGNYQITVPTGADALYTMQFSKDGTNGGITAIQYLHDGVNTFSYSTNGSYSASLKITELNIGWIVPPCYDSKRSVFVRCFPFGTVAYPNPFTSEVTLKNNQELVIKEVIITDIHGNEVLRSKKSIINIPQGKAGVFFANITYTDGTKDTLNLIRK